MLRKAKNKICTNTDPKEKVRLPHEMNFQKNSKRPLNPPTPSYSENFVANFVFGKRPKNPYINNKGPKSAT